MLIKEEEVDFLELLQTLFARKYLILGGTLLCAILAAVVTPFLPKQYEVSVLLDVARIADQPLENSYFVQEMINSESFLGSISDRLHLGKTQREMKKMVSATSDTQKSQFLVTVTVKAQDPKEAVRIARSVSDAIEEREKRLYEEKLQPYGEFEQELKQQIDQAGKDRRDLGDILQHMKAGSAADTSSMVLLQTQLENKETQMIGMLREQRDLRVLVRSQAHTHPAKLVNEPLPPTRPVRPSLILNVVVASILGFFLLILIIPASENYRERKKRLASTL